MILKETIVYKSEFMVFECPYCKHTIYRDIADDAGEGYFPDEGRKMMCEKCGEIMIVKGDT